MTGLRAMLGKLRARWLRPRTTEPTAPPSYLHRPRNTPPAPSYLHGRVSESKVWRRWMLPRRPQRW